MSNTLVFENLPAQGPLMKCCQNISGNKHLTFSKGFGTRFILYHYKVLEEINYSEKIKITFSDFLEPISVRRNSVLKTELLVKVLNWT